MPKYSSFYILMPPPLLKALAWNIESDPIPTTISINETFHQNVRWHNTIELLFSNQHTFPSFDLV